MIQNETGAALSRKEGENLSDSLSLGMTIDDARAAFQKEIETAKLKQKIRENKRARKRQRNGQTKMPPLNR